MGRLMMLLKRRLRKRKTIWRKMLGLLGSAWDTGAEEMGEAPSGTVPAPWGGLVLAREVAPSGAEPFPRGGLVMASFWEGLGCTAARMWVRGEGLWPTGCRLSLKVTAVVAPSGTVPAPRGGLVMALGVAPSGMEPFPRGGLVKARGCLGTGKGPGLSACPMVSPSFQLWDSTSRCCLGGRRLGACCSMMGGAAGTVGWGTAFDDAEWALSAASSFVHWRRRARTSELTM